MGWHPTCQRMFRGLMGETQFPRRSKCSLGISSLSSTWELLVVQMPRLNPDVQTQICTGTRCLVIPLHVKFENHCFRSVVFNPGSSSESSGDFQNS